MRKDTRRRKDTRKKERKKEGGKEKKRKEEKRKEKKRKGKKRKRKEKKKEEKGRKGKKRRRVQVTKVLEIWLHLVSSQLFSIKEQGRKIGGPGASVQKARSQRRACASQYFNSFQSL